MRNASSAWSATHGSPAGESRHERAAPHHASISNASHSSAAHSDEPTLARRRRVHIGGGTEICTEVGTEPHAAFACMPLRGYDLPARFWNNQRVSSVRDLRPVFVRILRTWLSTVRSERTNLLATSRFDKA